MVEVEDGRLVMGGYARTDPTVYVVAWPEAGVIKNGYSERQRWRKFVLRGAEVLALYAFPSNFSAAFDFEAYLDGKASMLYPRAFPAKCDEAARLLGPDCGGFVECFRADVDEWTSLLPEQCSPSNAQASTDADAHREAGAVPRSTHTYGRNVRTHAEHG